VAQREGQRGGLKAWCTWGCGIASAILDGRAGWAAPDRAGRLRANPGAPASVVVWMAIPIAGLALLPSPARTATVTGMNIKKAVVSTSSATALAGLCFSSPGSVTSLGISLARER
jgi:hypothetical protein